MDKRRLFGPVSVEEVRKIITTAIVPQPYIARFMYAYHTLVREVRMFEKKRTYRRLNALVAIHSTS